ncbi:heme A synthase [Corynebacterium lizhenjunii]|uniref:Heme A synthase n=1 Tax=Corynebacterium lizhenjunii TaxID=2709394 RepID=A0A7T0KCU2_9CORY|nr:heme A synthase [Corynebacterium lizhenjunii]QPK78172.1 heme A synthase [Corynebacterium lizhenjunii]
MNFFDRLRFFFREAAPSLRAQRRVALILLICQGGITVSGAIVRVTGSGLGCVTWPNCHPGSLVPLKGAAPLVHQAIEFGNRLLTFVIAAAAIAAVVAMHMACRRRELKVYAWLNVAGVVLQALIGALSVILELQWWAVALHFLPSMLLVWLAAMLYIRINEPDDGTPQRVFPQAISTLGAIAAAALAVVLATGTMVTGSGVHSGDAGVGMEGRLNVDPQAMAITHAICMYVYLFFTVVTVILIFRHRLDPKIKTAGLVLLAVILMQWGIGVFQYYMHIPRWTVPIHVAFSSIVTACTAILWARGIIRTGGEPASATGSPAGDAKRAAYLENSARKKVTG